MKSHPLS